MIFKSKHLERPYYVAWSCSNTLDLLTDHCSNFDQWNHVSSTFTRLWVMWHAPPPPDSRPSRVTLESDDCWCYRLLVPIEVVPSLSINKHPTIFFTVRPWSLIQSIFVAFKASYENYPWCFSFPIMWHEGLSYACLEVVGALTPWPYSLCQLWE